MHPALCIPIIALASGLAVETPLKGSQTLGTPVSHRNLTLIPVYDRAARDGVNYVTLDEALKAKSVVVRETPSGGDVNRLLVTNRGKDPLYLMAGEVVLGGQQDRAVGTDMVIAPGKKDVPVTVFCVEHGRWNGQAEFKGSASSVAASKIRSIAQSGVIDAAKPASPVARPAVVGLNRVDQAPPRAAVDVAGRADLGFAQGKVWEKVAEKNKRFKASSASGTYRGVLNLEGGSAGKEVAPYVRELNGALGSDPRLVGVIVGINGEPAAADIFNSPRLFRKLWPKLLKSYASEAAEEAGGKAKNRSLSAKSASDFVNASHGAAAGRTEVAAGVRLETKRATTFQFSPARAAGASAPAAASMPVHTNVNRK